MTPVPRPAPARAAEPVESDYEITIDAEPPPSRSTETPFAAASPTAAQLRPMTPSAPLPRPAGLTAPAPAATRPLPPAAGAPPWGLGKPAAPAAPAPAAPPMAPLRAPTVPALLSPYAPAATAAPAAPVPTAPAAPAPMAPAPLPAAAATAMVSAGLQEVLARMASKGPEYAALAEIARPIIEQVIWEIVPDLTEIILREHLSKQGK